LGKGEKRRGKMQTYDFVHLSLYALGGKIKGSTKLQKTVYFIGVMTETVEELGFYPHFYGPYSDEVASATARLQGLGFLERTFKVVRYDYALNKEGRQIAKEKTTQYPTLWKKIQKAVSVLKRVGDQDYMKLSVAAKTYFMLCGKSALPGQKQTATMEELVKLAKKFGWKVNEKEVKEAANLLQKIKLVTVTGS
jgi:uncharacterized protein YwgA